MTHYDVDLVFFIFLSFDSRSYFYIHYFICSVKCDNFSDVKYFQIFCLSPLDASEDYAM